MRYGANEYRYASPVAGALEQRNDFRRWLLGRTKFSLHAEGARLLCDQQRLTRSLSAENWWRSYWVSRAYEHFHECGERETDLLAIFETPNSFRFALHIEVKAPGDRFGVEQAADYRRRANCWKGRDRAPRTVLPHDDAATLLLCDRGFAGRNAAKVAFFDTVFFHDEIGAMISPYPDA